MNCVDTRNILLTGTPRSGTTLACSLLNQLPECVALHEPMNPLALAGLSPVDLVAAINGFLEQQRARIQREGRATSKSSNGRVPKNPLADPDGCGIRRDVLDGREVIVDGITDPHFRLFVKHPAFFTAALPLLAHRFACFALVRNPLAVLISWRNSGMPIGGGRAPAAEAHDPSLAAALDAEPEVLERQFLLLDYFINRYLTYLPGRIIKYEEVIVTGGRALSMLSPAASALDEPLESRNRLFLRNDPATDDIARRLLCRESPCWTLYARTSVEALLP